MGFLKSALNVASGGLGSAIGSASGVLGISQNNLLSGIPFIGEGFAQQSQQDFNSAQAANQMAFQKMMSDTAHQREVEDLRKAGLNPILSGTGGMGASTPSGAMGSSGAISGASSSAQMVKSMYNKERQLASSKISETDASTSKLSQDEKTSAANEQAINATKNLTEAQTAVANTNAKILESDLELKSIRNKIDSKIESEWGELYRKMEMLGGAVGTANQFKDLINPLGGILKLKKVPKGFQRINPRTGETLD